jgi:Domain of unknown function (DUF3854)
VAGCMRVATGSFKTAPTGLGDMHLHRLRDDCASSLRIVPPPQRRPRRVIPLASIDDRNIVYPVLLDRLTLSPEHADFLTIDKRITHETIVKNLYATVPDPDTITTVVSSLAEQHHLAGVPGVCRERGAWRLVAKPGELLIPVRDHQGRIVAVLRRTGGTPKYAYLSSADRGASCGTPLHFARPYLAELHRSIVITEGILKADCIAELLHVAVVGIPGVSAFGDEFGRELRTLFPAVETILVAFDADSERNTHVRDALVRLLRSFRSAGLTSVDVLQWDEARGNGLDDVLLGGAA